MQREETRTELGLIRIHKNVIASIASIGAIEIEGVKRVANNLASGIMEIIGKASPFSIKVDFNKNEEVKIDIPIIVKYGFNIPEVANRVQDNIRMSLEKMTSLSVKDINVNVQGVERG
ncbi:MAG: Asp23/Gls24 family envelope stress response protein [Candidatus Omnitrophota bacterium]